VKKLPVWGSDGGSSPSDEWDVPQPSARYNLRSTRDIINYFFYHPRGSVLGRKAPSDSSRVILHSTIKRLRSMGLSDDQIRRGVDRFFQNDRHRDHPEPHRVFSVREVQRRLFSEVDYDEKSTAPSSTDSDPDHVMKFLAHGMSRDDDMELPFPPSMDSYLRMSFGSDPYWNRLVRTYPEVVALLLRHYADDETGLTEEVERAVVHHRYLLGEVDARPDPWLSDELVGDLPSDFIRKGAYPRTPWGTVEGAVRGVKKTNG